MHIFKSSWLKFSLALNIKYFELSLSIYLGQTYVG